LWSGTTVGTGGAALGATGTGVRGGAALGGAQLPLMFVIFAIDGMSGVRRRGRGRRFGGWPS
jgi:hypothetical protein